MKLEHIITTGLSVRDLGGSGRKEIIVTATVGTPALVSEVHAYIDGLLNGTEVPTPAVDGVGDNVEDPVPDTPPRARRSRAKPVPEPESESEPVPEPESEPESESESEPESESESESEPESEATPSRRRRGRGKPKDTDGDDKPKGPTKQDVAKAASLGAEELGADVMGDIISEYSESGMVDDIPTEKRQAFIDEVNHEVSLPSVEED